MMFTAQQLCGGATYTKAKLGNWCEDQDSASIKLAEFLAQKANNSLKVVQKQLKQESALAPRMVSISEDGFVKFGQQIMIQHSGGGFVSCNGDDVVAKSDLVPAIGVTTSRMSGSCTRNVFTIERADEFDGFQGDEVHFGQSFYLKASVQVDHNEGFEGWLHSDFISPLAAAKVSRKQEVCLYSVKNGKTIWQFQWPDTKETMTFDGDKVPVGTDLVMRHNATGGLFGSDKIAYENMFGMENEVHCHCYYSKNKTHNLMSERNGQVTGDFQMRRILAENCFKVVMGSPAVEAEN